MPKKYKTKISRRVAIEKLESLIERAVIWNKDYASRSSVSALVLVGSLARNEDKVGDVDVACEVKQTDPDGNSYHDLDEYLEWRKDVLGYAVPTQYHLKLYTIEGDPKRFIRNRDGRIELLRWDQLELVALALQPIVTIFKDGTFLFNSIEDAIAAAKPITMAVAKKIIAGGRPKKPQKSNDEYWESYCITVNHLPRKIGDLILKRDGYAEAFKAYAKNNVIPDRIE